MSATLLLALATLEISAQELSREFSPRALNSTSTVDSGLGDHRYPRFRNDN